MRSLALLGLIALSTLPLAARDHDHGPWRGRGPRRVVVMEARPGLYERSDDYPYDRYEDRCDDDRWERREVREYRPWHRERCDDDDDVVVVRPRSLAPRWGARIVLRYGR